MNKKTLRTISLAVIVCCMYSIYKLPSLYWSLKVRLSVEKRDSVIEKTSNGRGGTPTDTQYDFNHKDLVETFNSNKKLKGKEDINRITTQNAVSESKENKTYLNLGIKVHSEEEEKQSAINRTKLEPANVLADIDKEEFVNGSREISTTEETSTDLQNDQFADVLKEMEEKAPIPFNHKINDDEKFDGQFVFGEEDVEFDINEVNAYQKASENLFKTFPNHQNATKWLIYYCDGKCGGFADRLKGISTVYILSILMERRFAISMTTPCELDRFLEPNLLNWKYPSKEEIVGKTLKTIDFFERHDAYEIDFQKYDPDPKTMTIMKADVVQLKANQDWTRIFRKMSVSPKRFPQLYQYHSSELLKTIFSGLFKLSPELNERVNDFFTENVKDKKLACLHARMGEEANQRYTYREIMIPLTSLKKFDSLDNYRIMVATDTDKVKTIAKHMFKNFVDTSGPILHIDYIMNSTQDRKCAGFMRSLVDHTVLQRCDRLVLTGSGFGVTASSIRHTSHGLYVYVRGEDVMPTRRELVREIFQWRCLAASWDMQFYRNICDS